MLRMFALACATTMVLIISKTSTLEQRNPGVMQNKKSSFQGGSPLFLFHLLKLKTKIQKIENVPTIPPTGNCICVPYYLCNANGTIVIDGIQDIDVRYRRCTGDTEVCCRPISATANATTTTTTTMKTTTTTKTTPTTTTTTTTMKTTTTTKTTPTTTTTAKPTTSPTTTTTTTTTLPPVIFPSTEPPPATSVCICVSPSQCVPNGIIGSSGEGVINPRLQYVQCPSSDQVCCRPTSVIQYPTAPPSTQICTLCGGNIQCSNGVVVPINVAVVSPMLTYGQTLCPVPTTCCQGVNPIYTNGIPVVLGPVKYPGTSQACYCMKTWLCSQDNSVGLGAIDPRFSACGSPDEVCCRAGAISDKGRNLQSNQVENIVSGEAPFSQPGCGVPNKTFAPAQSYPTDTGKTYFAEFPWMVALLAIQPDGTYLFQCGGAMITNKAVLTAAHCVAKGNGRLVARFGVWNLDNQPKDQPAPFQEVNVQTVINHPLFYNAALFNDIAVLILAQPVTQNINIAPICVPQQALIFPAGTRCLGSGWGKNSFGGTYQTELRKVELPIVGRTDCQNRLRTTRLGPYFQLHTSFICAGGEVNKDTCSGDGGGPLVCPTATGQYVQAGIVSWGIGCGNSDVPAVYTNVAQHTQWIAQQLATYGA